MAFSRPKCNTNFNEGWLKVDEHWPGLGRRPAAAFASSASPRRSHPGRLCMYVIFCGDAQSMKMKNPARGGVCCGLAKILPGIERFLRTKAQPGPGHGSAEIVQRLHGPRITVSEARPVVVGAGLGRGAGGRNPCGLHRGPGRGFSLAAKCRARYVLGPIRRPALDWGVGR